MTIQLADDGPTVPVRCSLPTFPDKPPLRWKHHGYNAAIIELRLVGASEIRIEGWSNESTGTITLNMNGSAARFVISGPRLRFTADALAVDITHVEGYHRAS
jgi:hypothetical protein